MCLHVPATSSQVNKDKPSNCKLRLPRIVEMHDSEICQVGPGESAVEPVVVLP